MAKLIFSFVTLILLVTAMASSSENVAPAEPNDQAVENFDESYIPLPIIEPPLPTMNERIERS